MLVSHVCRFIYLKTIKTAGTSVEIYFEPYCVDAAKWTGERHGREEEVSEYGIVGARGSEEGYITPGTTWYNHMSAALVRERLGGTIWDSYLKFCVVRNPFDKVVSAFWYQMDGVTRARLAAGDFSEVRAAFDRWVAGARLPVDDGIFLPDGRLAVDVAIRFEHLSGDLREVCGKLGVPWQPSRLGRYKSGFRVRSEDMGEYYGGSSRQLVERAFEREFHYFYSHVTA